MCLAVSTVCGLTLQPSSALAAFTRPFLRQIDGTSGGPFEAIGGVAVDGSDDAWIGDGEATNRLDEFAPSYETSGPTGFIKSLAIEAFTFPESLAVEATTGNFYLTGHDRNNNANVNVEVVDETGAQVETWTDAFGYPTYVAIDNSADAVEDESACGTTPLLSLSECFVYVAHGKGDPAAPVGDGKPVGIEKFNPTGEPVDFTGAGPCVKDNEIVGVPSESGKSCESEFFNPRGVAVDSVGDIYAVDPSYTRTGLANRRQAVVEFAPSGAFVQAFGGEATPGVGESHEEGGWGGLLEWVAIDPVSDHMLVSITHSREGSKGREPVEGAVDEFDVASGRYLSQVSEAEVEGSGGEHELRKLSSARAMTVDSAGDLYVVDPTQGNFDVFGPGRFLPSLRLAEPSGHTSHVVVVHGAIDPESTVNPEKAGLSECFFEYVTEASFVAEGFASPNKAQCVPGASEIPKDSSFHAVEATIEGLEPGVTYRYRLVGRTEGALGGEAESATAAFTTQAPPVIGATFASNISSTYADLNARIEPRGANTSYRFEYDTREYREGEGAHGVSVPVPDEPIGAGGPTGVSEESVLQHIGPLATATTYHFRVVAQSEIEGALVTKDGPDEAFSTLAQVVPGLPDGREYELVTPASKPGGSDMFATNQNNGEYFNEDVGTPATAGNGFILHTHDGFGPFPGNEESAYVFDRTADDWAYTSLALASLGVQNVYNSFVFEPENLTAVGLNDFVGSTASAGGERLTNLVGPPGGPYTTLHVDEAVHAGSNAGEARTQIVGASRDLGYIVLESASASACPGAEKLKHGHLLCEWAGGTLKPLNVDSKGSLLSTCGAVLGGGSEGGEHDAVSPDGARAIVTAPDPGAKGAGPGCWEQKEGREVNAPQVYMRIGSRTLELSAPEPGVTEPGSGEEDERPVPYYAAYAGASEGDSKVFFYTAGWLTNNHPEGHDRELYECEVIEEPGGPKCKLTRISADDAGGPGALVGAAVNTVPAISASGSAVYFTAFGALAPGASSLEEPESPDSNAPVNLYRYETPTPTAPGSITYVTTVTTLDYPTQHLGCSVVGYPRALCAKANWYTTPDGRYLLFATSNEVTGYGTVGPCRELPEAGGVGDGHCDELYRYDALAAGRGEASIVCVSCNPSGAPPVSNAEFARSAPTQPSSNVVRAMSDNGAFVFFDTADALVPQDSNETLDVYEWHDGHIALVSSGTDAGPSYFLGYSPYTTPSGTVVEGGNVFIGTHAALVAEDKDTSGDVYDARICSAEEPCLKAAAGTTGQCEGSACQTPSPPPVDVTPTSFTFTGAGDLPGVPPAPKPKAKALTKAPRLAKALAACRRKRNKHRRVACERRARRKYKPKRKSKHGKRKSSAARLRQGRKR
jgi:hypothetical protein